MGHGRLAAVFDVEEFVGRCQDGIREVTNPLRRITGAIHVYGGDFVNRPRSQWGPGPLEERPYDIEVVNAQFAEANAAAGLVG
ncbi:MAG: hypothetical protein JO265_01010 [Acidimicrobiia bacterium]|nr:hypothetical protein [Acidimicrobiia bacterium]